jgi:tRNA threonylcarbamoyladenosine biosynthesis protein TsaB
VSLILNIETSTTVCSVSLAKDGQLLAGEELDAGYTHAENLHVFIKKLFETTGFKPTNLDAIAVSKGPGSYTGLRIGVSTAKGLAYSLNVPLISAGTLEIMALKALEQTKDKSGFYCPMIDARRMEVYNAVFDGAIIPVKPVNAMVVDTNGLKVFEPFKPVYFFGDGMEKCRPLLETLSGSAFIQNIRPTALSMPQFTHSKYLKKSFEDLAYFEPFYLKEFLIGKKKTAEKGF